jgi:hypothetical protein
MPTATPAKINPEQPSVSLAASPIAAKADRRRDADLDQSGSSVTLGSANGTGSNARGCALNGRPANASTAIVKRP